MPDSAHYLVYLLICQTCRRVESPLQTIRPGAKLLQKCKNANLPEQLGVIGVDCLSNCRNGCTIVLQGLSKWTYVYGNIDPDSDFEQLRKGVADYFDSEEGIVPWRKRVPLFKKNCIARIPPVYRGHQTVTQ